MDLHLGGITKVQEMVCSTPYDAFPLGPTPIMLYITALQASPDELLQLLIFPAEGSEFRTG